MGVHICLQLGGIDFFWFLFHHSLFNIFQTVSLGLWYKDSDEKDADEAKETEEPECAMSSNRFD